MRIGVDGQALQTPNSRQRGIGIYTEALLDTLLAGTRKDEYHLFFSSLFQRPSAFDARAGTHTIPLLKPVGAHELHELTDALELLQRLAYEGEELELLHVASPVEGYDAVIDRVARPYSFPVTCMLFDLIPLVFSQAYLSNPVMKRLYLRRLELYSNADLVFAISEHSRRDAVRLLGIDERRILNVGAAVQPSFRRLDPAEAERSFSLTAQPMGIRRPFVLFTGGFDFRKNLEGMIKAFSALPAQLRRSHQLVIVCALTADERLALKKMAERYGAGDALLLTGYIPLETLVVLYNSCDLFVFPSLYEGFGLPVLEAMTCGAPVIASNSSSIPEVLGDAGIAIDPTDFTAIAKAMASVLESTSLRDELSQRSLERAKRFSWQITADKVGEGFQQARRAWQRSKNTLRHPKPKIAYFSPLPPQRSGISDYSAELLPHLAEHFDIDVFLDGYAPSRTSGESSITYHSSSGSFRNSAYYSTVFQMGNSAFHAYMYDLLLQYPGITVLHDVYLHNLVEWIMAERRHNRQRYIEELTYENGELARVALEMLQNRELDHPRLTALFPLNERVLCASKGVIVHSDYAKRELLHGHSSSLAPRVRHINQGMAIPSLPSAERRQALKLRFSIPSNSFVVGTFGIMAEPKLLEPGLHAFQRLLSTVRNAHYVGVGQFLSPEYEASIKALCQKLGITSKVTFTGHVTWDDFYNYLFICDAVLNLRYPTRGETSAAMLRALSCGIATIVNDLAAFSELPDDIVVKIKHGQKLEDELLGALTLLADDAGFRERVGAAARRHMIEHHSWRAIATQYADFIHYIEANGLGDQTALRESLRDLAAKTRLYKKTKTQRVNEFVEAFAASPALGRILWV